MDMNLTEVSRKVDGIIEDVFSKNNIGDKSERVRMLRKCMYVLDTSNSNVPVSLDDEYSDELAIFLISVPLGYHH